MWRVLCPTSRASGPPPRPLSRWPLLKSVSSLPPRLYGDHEDPRHGTRAVLRRQDRAEHDLSVSGTDHSNPAGVQGGNGADHSGRTSSSGLSATRLGEEAEGGLMGSLWRAVGAPFRTKIHENCRCRWCHDVGVIGRCAPSFWSRWPRGDLGRGQGTEDKGVRAVRRGRGRARAPGSGLWLLRIYLYLSPYMGTRSRRRLIPWRSLGPVD